MAKKKQQEESTELVLAQAGKLVKIESDEQFSEAARLRKLAKEFVKEVEASYRPLIKKIDESKKAALAEMRAKLAPFEQAATGLTALMEAWQDQKDREAAAEAEAARKELEKKAARAEKSGKAEKAEDLREQADLVQAVPEKAQADAALVVKVVDFEIEDEGAVPRSFCTPEPKLIREYVRVHGASASIPGVRVFVRNQIRAK